MNEESMSIATPHPGGVGWMEKSGMALSAVGVLILLVAWAGVDLASSTFLPIALGAIVTGVLLVTRGKYSSVPKGIKNNGVFFSSMTNRGLWGWFAGIILTGFYVCLYWSPSTLGLNDAGGNSGIVGLFDSLSMALKGKPSSQWFVYGTLYTVAILALGVKFIYKYRHNRYQLIRTISVMITQLFLAYLIPEILESLNYNGASATDGTYLGYYTADIKNTWPLNHYFFLDWNLDAMQQATYQPIGKIYLYWGIAMFLIVTPVLTYFVGKRWYCSWVCGCGGLAETAGDPYRHLSNKKLGAWRLERWLIHAVMVFIFVATLGSILSYTGVIKGAWVYTYLERPYGFLIGSMFSGVIGVGFYPLLGNRVWCRFGCPMAGYMGIIQRFKSRFRITTNGGQCISCGNCSTYCEQGIDVRWYAQRGQNIVRASCVGCGICSAVCPRGVLKLENGPEAGRINNEPILIGTDSAQLNPSAIQE